MMDLKGLFNGRLFFWRMKVFGFREVFSIVKDIVVKV
jgi:hypothetical protein